MGRRAKSAGGLVIIVIGTVGAVPIMSATGADQRVRPPSTAAAAARATDAKVSGRVARVTRASRRPIGVFVTGRQVVTRGGRRSALARSAAGPGPLGRPGVERLAATPYAPLIGDVAPAAQVSPDGGTLAYDSWQWVKKIDWQRGLAGQGIRPGDPLGTPTLRLRDLAAGTEELLPAGTMSAAFRSDGALAYAQGTTPSYLSDERYTRNVVVREPGGAAKSWSQSADEYTVMAWAGSRLIARRDVPTQLPDLVIFDAPGQARLLAPGSELIALDAEGERALVSTGSIETEASGIALVSVADGRLLSKIPLSALVDPANGQPVTWVGGAGSWEGDRVVFGSSVGMTVVTVDDSQLVAADVVHMQISGADASPIVHEPRFADASAGTVVGWSTIGAERSANQHGVQYQCELATKACSRVLTQPQDTPRPVYNLSEPSTP
jgi:hypothetical protein